MSAATSEFTPESDFDGYVYVLECRRESDGETIYYVGTARDMAERITDHVAADGDFSGPAPDGYLATKDEVGCSTGDSWRVYRWRRARSARRRARRDRRG